MSRAQGDGSGPCIPGSLPWGRATAKGSPAFTGIGIGIHLKEAVAVALQGSCYAAAPAQSWKVRKRLAWMAGSFSSAGTHGVR